MQKININYLINLNPLFFSQFTVTHAGPHEKRLLHHLLDNYNSLERPVVNESDPLQLSFGLTLMQIIDVVSQKYLSNQFSENLFFIQLVSP